MLQFEPRRPVTVPSHLKIAGAAVALLLLATVGNLLLTAASLQADVHAGIPVNQTAGASDMTLLLDGSRAFIHAQASRPLYGTRIR